MRKIIFLLFISIFINCSTDSKDNLLSLFVITEELEVGENRVVLTVLDENGKTLTNGLKFYFREFGNEKKTEITSKNISNWPPNRKVFVTNINFDKVGYWEFLVESSNGGAKATINVKEDSKTLGVGDSIDPIYTPSLDKYKISDITTDINPNPDFYSYSLDSALLEGKPFFITFSTPGLCVTGTCSPQLEELKEISKFYDEAIIIHVEIWQNFKEVMQKGDSSLGILNDSVKKFGIETEPWTFLIDEDGMIIKRYQGFVEFSELQKDYDYVNN